MSYHFDSDSDEITFPHISAFDGANKATFSWWFKSDGNPSWKAHLQQYPGNNQGFWIGPAGSDITSLRLASEAGGERYFQRNSGLSISAATWTHFYCVFDGTQAEASRWRLWIDGTENSTWNNTTADETMGTNTDLLRIGKDQRCYLAEIAMWIGEAVTTSGVIAALAGGALASNANGTGLDFYARFLDNANDSAGSRTATVSNATLSGDHPTMTAAAADVSAFLIEPNGGGGIPG